MIPKRRKAMNPKSTGPIPKTSKPSLPEPSKQTSNSPSKGILALKDMSLVVKESVQRSNYQFLKKLRSKSWSRQISAQIRKKSKLITVISLMQTRYITLLVRTFMFLGSRIWKNVFKKTLWMMKFQTISPWCQWNWSRFGIKIVVKFMKLIFQMI